MTMCGVEDGVPGEGAGGDLEDHLDIPSGDIDRSAATIILELRRGPRLTPGTGSVSGLTELGGFGPAPGSRPTPCPPRWRLYGALFPPSRHHGGSGHYEPVRVRIRIRVRVMATPSLFGFGFVLSEVEGEVGTSINIATTPSLLGTRTVREHAW